MTSPDGITWTSRTPAADNYWEAVTYANGLFVAVSSTGTSNRVMTFSYDNCPAGKFLVGDGNGATCSVCPSGTYLATSGCDTTCTNCASGKYLSDAGITVTEHDSEGDCLDCADGKVSNAGSGSCSTSSPSDSPSATTSASPSASPTASPSAAPSASPSASPSVSPSASPSVSPSASPSATPLVYVAPSDEYSGFIAWMAVVGVIVVGAFAFGVSLILKWKYGKPIGNNMKEMTKTKGEEGL